MHVIDTDFEGIKLIEYAVFSDERGYFYESYNQREWEKRGLFYQFVQDNQSLSKYGVIRGLHYQEGSKAQAKLIRVLKGKIWDVCVDIRPKSMTFGKYFAVELSEECPRQLLVPRGFAHGFSVLTDEALVAYKCDHYYFRDAERGIAFNDWELGIDWKIDASRAQISMKDLAHPSFAEWKRKNIDITLFK